MLPNDSRLPHEVKRLAERLYYDDKRNGKQNDTALAFMAGAMVLIGAQILMGLFKKSEGIGR